MESNHETFFNSGSFAVVGHSTRKPFPGITYGKLKKLGKKVFPIDASTTAIQGDKAYSDLGDLPEKVDAVIIEVPKDETRGWVEKAAAAGIKDVWIHQNCDTDEALAVAKEHGINARTGTCAVMYLKPGLSVHAVHGFVQKLRGKY